MLRGGARAGRSDIVEDLWNQALDFKVEGKGERFLHKKWVPDIDAFDALITSYLRNASTANIDVKRALYEKCVTTYLDVLWERSSDKQLHHIDSAKLRDSSRSMLLVLIASVSLEAVLQQYRESMEDFKFSEQKVREIANDITSLYCLQGRLPKSFVDVNPSEYFQKARSWARKDRSSK